VTYETYDPAEKRWLEGQKPGSRLFEAEGGDWMAIGNLRAVSWYAQDDRHRLKVANLDNLVPTPSHLTRLRIYKVDKPDYYEGVLALAGRKRTPPGVVVMTGCRTLDRCSRQFTAEAAPRPSAARSDRPPWASVNRRVRLRALAGRAPSSLWHRPHWEECGGGSPTAAARCRRGR
jgi:hypothetical protein